MAVRQIREQRFLADYVRMSAPGDTLIFSAGLFNIQDIEVKDQQNLVFNGTRLIGGIYHTGIIIPIGCSCSIRGILTLSGARIQMNAATCCYFDMANSEFSVYSTTTLNGAKIYGYINGMEVDVKNLSAYHVVRVDRHDEPRKPTEAKVVEIKTRIMRRMPDDV